MNLFAVTNQQLRFKRRAWSKLDNGLLPRLSLKLPPISTASTSCTPLFFPISTALTDRMDSPLRSNGAPAAEDGLNPSYRDRYMQLKDYDGLRNSLIEVCWIPSRIRCALPVKAHFFLGTVVQGGAIGRSIHAAVS